MKRSSKLFLSGIVMMFVVALSTILFLSSMGINSENYRVKFPGYWFAETKETIKGDGKIITKSLSLAQFNAISAGGNFRVSVKSGDQEQISITTDDNILKHIFPSVKDGELQINTDRPLNLSPTHRIEVNITSSQLEKIHLGGESILNAVHLNTPSLEVSLDGDNQAILSGHISQCTLNLGGNSTVDLTVSHGDSVQINNAGNGKLQLAGATQDLTINNGGNITVSGQKLTAKNVTVSGVGNTQVDIHATDLITVQTVGDSTLRYSGNPKIINRGVGQIDIYKGVKATK